ncbi:MAG TPA: hypothetical protein VMY42_23705 [Thermoguttaceae bacterium]|nr:hypothetical protein [Thermoguttaceae bacterium]
MSETLWSAGRRAVLRAAVHARCVAVFWLVALGASTACAQGLLGTMREDVRAPSSGSSSDGDDDDDDHRDHSRGYHGHHHDDDSIFGEFFGTLAFYTVTSPWWAPPAAMGDSYDVELFFPRFPYDHTPGYMAISNQPVAVPEDPMKFDPYNPELGPVDFSRPLPGMRTWSARLRGEFATDNNHLERIGGHLLLSTSSRWGLDTEMSFLEESLSGGGRDRLWLGDCNLVFRFAQSEHVQWRTGIGFNWLDDPAATNFGFNFTYGMDWFPARPWVVSSTLDWGTLGRAEQFRFRTTAGVLLRGLESYVGYEYYDLDRTQMNMLIGGVRVWF